MTEEFKLSNQRYCEPLGLKDTNGYMYKEEDVKEFIKRLKDNSWDLTGKSSDYVEGYNEAFRVIAKKINKLAGPKLSEKTEEEKE